MKSFCIIAISGGLAMAISPEGSLKKYVKYIISLCVVCTLLSPFLSFAEKAPEYLEELDIEIKEVSADVESDTLLSVALAAKDNIENEVSSLISSQFGYNSGDIYTIVTIDSEDLSAVRITDVTVFLSDISKKDEVKEYISELFLETANIHIMKKGAGT